MVTAETSTLQQGVRKAPCLAPCARLDLQYRICADVGLAVGSTSRHTSDTCQLALLLVAVRSLKPEARSPRLVRTRPMVTSPAPGSQGMATKRLCKATRKERQRPATRSTEGPAEYLVGSQCAKASHSTHPPTPRHGPQLPTQQGNVPRSPGAPEPPCMDSPVPSFFPLPHAAPTHMALAQNR